MKMKKRKDTVIPLISAFYSYLFSDVTERRDKYAVYHFFIPLHLLGSETLSNSWLQQGTFMQTSDNISSHKKGSQC